MRLAGLLDIGAHPTDEPDLRIRKRTAVAGLAVLFASLIPAGGLPLGASNLVWIILVPIAAVLFLGARAGPAALAGVVVVVAAGIVATR